MADLNPVRLEIQIEAAVMLLRLGLVRREEIEELFIRDGHDPVMRSQLMMSVDARI